MTQATPLPLSLINLAEAEAIIALLLVSSDDRFEAWATFDGANKAKLVRMATAAVQALPMIGVRQDAAQTLEFPRYYDEAESFDLGDESDYGLTEAWSVAGVPRIVREAVAMQSAYEALCQVGGSAAIQTRRMAAQGITSMSGVGGARALDMHRPTAAESRVDPDVHDMLSPILRRTGDSL